ncbi:MAG TPA: hypothetical protein VK009_04220, partial [Chloroflexota bacterium]|nr:hypothetical protein [Chloroflexota bacterium]
MDLVLLPSVLLAYLIACFATLSQYGISWDEPENFLIGDLLMRSISTLSPRPYQSAQVPGDLSRYPPVANVASALADSLLSARLGLLNYVEGHHAAVVIFGALGLAAVYALARAFGKLAAL